MSALECLRPITGLRDRWSAGRREIRSMPMKMNSQSTEQDRMESLGSMMAGLPEGHDSFRGLPCRCVSHRRACAGGPRTEGSALRCRSLEQPPSWEERAKGSRFRHEAVAQIASLIVAVAVESDQQKQAALSCKLEQIGRSTAKKLAVCERYPVINYKWLALIKKRLSCIMELFS